MTDTIIPSIQAQPLPPRKPTPKATSSSPRIKKIAPKAVTIAAMVPAPNDGHLAAPAGMLAPQFLQVMPIWPVVAPVPILLMLPMLPIGIEPMGWPGIIDGAIAGL